MRDTLKRTNIAIVVVSAFFLCMAGFCNMSFADENTIAVILSRNIAPYKEAFSGFKKKLSSGSGKVSYKRFDLDDKSIKDDIISVHPGIVLAIGTEAALYVRENFKEIPVVFMMVLNPVGGGVVGPGRSGSKNITGVSLDISVEKQFRLIRRIKPDVRSIGILYDVREVEIQKKAEKAASRSGVKLLSKGVNSKAEVVKKLKELCSEADFIWAQVDSMIYNATSAKHVLLTTIRHKTPFMAFSSNFVKAGALVAMECDYSDIGRQAGEIAQDILNGKSPASIPIAEPEKLKVFINYRTAKAINLTLPKNLSQKDLQTIRID